MPSADFLLKQGFSKVVVRSSSVHIQNDLSHILNRYNNKGIDIYICKGNEVRKIPIVKPSKFKSLSYRFKVIFGLTRNATGGFGGWVPELRESSRRHYGVG